MVQTIEPPLKQSPRVEDSVPKPNDHRPHSETDANLQVVKALPKKPHPEAPKKLLAAYEAFLIPALILFLMGNALAFALPNLAFARYEVGIPLCVVFLGIVVYGITQKHQGWAVKLNFWLIALLAGSMHFHYRQFTPTTSDIASFAPLNRAEIMGTVLSKTDKNRAVIQVTQLNREKVSGQIQATLPSDNIGEPIEAGSRVLLDGELALPFQSTIPGSFNQAAYLHSQHITAVLRKPSRVIAFESDNQFRFTLQRVTDQLKRRVADTFTGSLPSPQAEILGGIVLGDRAIPVDRDTKQAFIQTGLIHLLAASGMNVGIIAGSILWLLSLLKVPYRKRIGIAMVAVAFYSLMTGLPPSIQRAATMLEIALFLKLLNRELSPVFLLCVASTLLVAINPETITSIGFQFSVLTTFGLLTMVAPLQEAMGYYITRWMAGIILVPVIAQLWVWPLSITYFNQFPIHTVPLNILALVLVAPLTLIGFTAGVLSLLTPALGGYLSWLALPFLNALLGMVRWGSSLEWAQWTLPSPAPWQVLLLYTGLFTLTLLLTRLKHWPAKFKILTGLLPVVIILGGSCVEAAYTRSQTRFTLLPLSYRHEAVLMRPANSNANLLITQENLGYFEARALGDYLRHINLTRLNALILLPGESARTNNSGNSLKTAFKKTTIDLLIAQNVRTVPEALKVELYRSFPKQGGKLQAGSLRLLGTLQQLRILSENRQCLLSIQDSISNPPAEKCGVQLVNQSSGTRLLAPANLQADRFYQLVQDGNSLKVY